MKERCTYCEYRYYDCGWNHGIGTSTNNPWDYYCKKEKTHNIHELCKKINKNNKCKNFKTKQEYKTFAKIDNLLGGE